jgi:hypothetical protein
MNIVVPDILAGGMGRAMQQTGQTIASSITAVGGGVQKVVDSVSAQVEAEQKAIKDQQSYVEATKLGEAVTAAKDNAYRDATNGSGPLNMQELRDTLNRIKQIGIDTIDQGQPSNPDVRRHAEEVNATSQWTYEKSLEGVFKDRLRQESSAATDQNVDREIAQAAKNLQIFKGAFKIGGLIDSQRNFLGDDLTDSYKQKQVSRFVIGTVFEALRNENAGVMTRILADPVENLKITNLIEPGSRALFQEAYTNVLNDLRMKEGFESVKMEGRNIWEAEKIWSRPETAARFGLTAEKWEEGARDFKRSVNDMNKKDVDAAKSAVKTVLGKLNNLDEKEVGQDFAGIQNPSLRAQYINHFKILMKEREMSKDQDPLEQGDSELETEFIRQSMENPGKVDMNSVNLLLGKGISLKAYQSIRDNVDEGANGVWQTETGKYTKYLLDNYLEGRKFNPEEKKNENVFIEAQGFMKDFVKRNPEARPAEIRKVYDDYLQPYRDAAMAQWFNEKMELIYRP